MTINPKSFVFDSTAALDKSRQERKYMQDNSHLALQFPIPELRYYFHPTMPGRVALVIAQSHNFKTEFMNFWAKTAAVDLADRMKQGKKRGVIVKISMEDAVEGIVESEIAAMRGGKLDDISQGIIKDADKFLTAETSVGGLPIIRIGESLGMEDSDASQLYLSNIAELIHYVKYDHYGEETPIAGIFCDYLQSLPPDPESALAKNVTDSKTQQIERDTNTFRRMAKRFSTAGVMLAQSPSDASLSTINEQIKLPGYWDIHWSKYPAMRADFMYSLWMPKMHYSIGDWVDNKIGKNVISDWNFKVENNSLWIKSLKHKKYTNVGASFPLSVTENGNVDFNSELYGRIKKMGKGE